VQRECSDEGGDQGTPYSGCHSGSVYAGSPVASIGLIPMKPSVLTSTDLAGKLSARKG
jgi:hypothetical protein